jgi:hypothetical protein
VPWRWEIIDLFVSILIVGITLASNLMTRIPVGIDFAHALKSQKLNV